MPKEKFYTSMNSEIFKEIFFTGSTYLLKIIIETTLGRKIEIKRASKKIDIITGEETDVIFVKTENDFIELVLNNTNNHTKKIYDFKRIWEAYRYDFFTAQNKSFVKNYIQINFTSKLPKKFPSLNTYTMYCDGADKTLENLKIYEYNMDKILNEVKSSDDKYAVIAMLASDRENLAKICKGNRLMENYKEVIEEINKNPEIVKKASEVKEVKFYNNVQF